MNKPRLLFTSLWSVGKDSVGGTERYILDMIQIMQKDYQITLLSLGHSNIEDVELLNLNLIQDINEYSLFEILENVDFFLNKIRNFINVDNFDIIHHNNLLLSCLWPNRICIHTIHTCINEFNELFPFSIRNKIITLLPQNDVYISPSYATQADFLKLTSIKSLVISHGYIDDVILQDNNALKLKYNIPIENLVICVPSRLELIQKGQELLLTSLRIIKQKIPPFSVLLSGYCIQYEKYKTYIIDNYFDLNILIGDFDRSEIFSISDLIVLPSAYESFGYSALDSLMLCKPTLLSNIPPHLELQKNTNNSSIFELNNESLSNACLDIINHSVKTDNNQDMSWKNKYSSELMYKKYQEVYCNVI